jgi:hypothetical protein
MQLGRKRKGGCNDPQKDVPTHNVEAYRRSGGRTPIIPKLGSR